MDTVPTWDQIKGTLDRLFIALAALAVGKGWISQSDAALYIGVGIALAGALYGYWINRPKAIVQSAAALPNTLVITTPALATATPNEKNIISTDSSKDAITRAVAVAVAEPKTEPKPA